MRVGPSKNRSGERLRTATARKNAKNRLRRRLRTHFFGSGPVFGRFWAPGRVPKLIPGEYFFGVFSKTVILSKSCSRCGGSVVFQGRTLPKLVPRPTPNRDGEKNRRKSPPAPSPDPLFQPRARFWSISGPRPDPKNGPKIGPCV